MSETTTMNLMDGIAYMRTLLAAATPVPWKLGEIKCETVEELAARAADATLRRDSATSYCAFVKGADGEALSCANSGNGPTSAANAVLIVAAINNLPTLLDAIERLAELIPAPSLSGSCDE